MIIAQIFNLTCTKLQVKKFAKFTQVLPAKAPLLRPQAVLTIRLQLATPWPTIRGFHLAVVIELFAGSGRFTAALKANGVHLAFGVDHKKLSSIAPIMIADLTTKAGQSSFMTWMDTPNLAGIFAAPPCGTCSVALHET